MHPARKHTMRATLAVHNFTSEEIKFHYLSILSVSHGAACSCASSIWLQLVVPVKCDILCFVIWLPLRFGLEYHPCLIWNALWSLCSRFIAIQMLRSNNGPLKMRLFLNKSRYTSFEGNETIWKRRNVNSFSVWLERVFNTASIGGNAIGITARCAVPLSTHFSNRLKQAFYGRWGHKR